MTQDVRPGASLAAVTPSDTQNVAQINGLWPRGLDIGTAGNVSLVAPDGSNVVLKNRPAGSFYPYAFMRVNSTSTTAADLTAIY